MIKRYKLWKLRKYLKEYHQDPVHAEDVYKVHKQTGAGLYDAVGMVSLFTYTFQTPFKTTAGILLKAIKDNDLHYAQVYYLGWELGFIAMWSGMSLHKFLYLIWVMGTPNYSQIEKIKFLLCEEDDPEIKIRELCS